MKSHKRDDRPSFFFRNAAWLAAALLPAAAAMQGAAAQQMEQGAKSIVQSAPATPASSEAQLQDFVELPATDAPLPSSASLHCSLDMIDDHFAPLAIVLDHRVPVTFVGWIADDGLGVPRNIVFLLIGDRTYEVAGTTGLARSDVAAAKHNPAFDFSGYSVTAEPAAVPQGEYRLALIAQFGSVRQLCPLGHTIAIK